MTERSHPAVAPASGRGRNRSARLERTSHFRAEHTKWAKLACKTHKIGQAFKNYSRAPIWSKLFSERKVLGFRRKKGTIRLQIGKNVELYESQKSNKKGTIRLNLETT